MSASIRERKQTTRLGWLQDLVLDVCHTRENKFNLPPKPTVRCLALSALSASKRPSTLALSFSLLAQ